MLLNGRPPSSGEAERQGMSPMLGVSAVDPHLTPTRVLHHVSVARTSSLAGALSQVRSYHIRLVLCISHDAVSYCLRDAAGSVAVNGLQRLRSIH